MKKRQILNLAARVGLIALILGLGMAAVSRMGAAAITDRVNTLALTMVRAGQELKAPGAVGLQQPVAELLGVIAFVLLSGLATRLHLAHSKARPPHQSRYLWLAFSLWLLFVGAAWVVVTEGGLLAYLFPWAALSIIAAVLIDAQFSILITILMGLIIGFMAGGLLQPAVYSATGGLVGVLSLGRDKSMNRLIQSGAYIALSNVLVVLIFYNFNDNFGPIGLLEFMAVGVTNGVITTSLTLSGLFFIGNLPGITTSIQLLDLAQPTHPLLRQLLLHAPGAYHHSLMVGNLAEQAAERIGADALLTRVGAYYHDIGKIQRLSVFSANQLYETNNYDSVEPRAGAQAMISHVKDGLELAKKYGLPHEVRVFIAEHHGAGRVDYFYQQALKQAADPTQVDETGFRYPGPKPQSRETALVMLADSCEAAMRAVQPTSVEALDRLIRRRIIDKIERGELDQCDLTMPELELIHNTFVEILQGVFHHRIEYPPEVKEGPAGAALPMLPAPSQPHLIVGGKREERIEPLPAY